MKLSFFLLLTILPAVVYSSAWNSRNDPTNFSSFLSDINYNLKTLPSTGRLQTTPWADTYWPSYLSGIAFRWASSDPQNFNYSLNTKQQLKAMSQSALLLLSPAEKYDIFVGRYDYPTVQAEWQRTSPNDQRWEGICHGWAVAAMQYAQPSPVTLTNPDGIKVPFASSDVKALLDYFVAEYANQYASENFIGDRCNYDIEQDPTKENSTACADLNAGAFHVLIANMLSKNVSMGFVGDRDRSIQVWNQPVFKFITDITGETRQPSSKSASGTKTEILVDTQIFYTLEMRPQFKPITNPTVGDIHYTYWLELDGQGNIVGGSYDSWERLDFSWMQTSVIPFSGFFKSVETIYQASTNGSHIFANVRPMAKLPATVLTASEGELRASPAGKEYDNDQMVRWAISPQGASAIEFEFVEFSTERHRDKVRIYEGAEGEGALVGVFHGTLNQVPSEPFVVKSSGAVVVFKSDHWGSDAGFLIRYRAVA